MQQKIGTAIKERVVIQFTYNEQREVVEPFIIGYPKKSSILTLLGYKIIAEHNERPWKMYALTDISDLIKINLSAYSYRGGMRRYANKFDTIVVSPNRFNLEAL